MFQLELRRFKVILSGETLKCCFDITLSIIEGAKNIIQK